ncbi:sigma 54-interacting transcriptional regulator [bacterium]|nr:sigma 54-interacting transcriptional regulator [bacterium]
MEEILKHAAEPIFILNEHGSLVLCNRSFDVQTGFGQLSASEKARFVEQYLRPPLDLPTGQARSACRVIEAGSYRAWWTITFLSLQTSEQEPLAILGYLARAADQGASGAVPIARDAVADEQLALLAQRQRTAGFEKIIVAQSAAMQRVVEQMNLAAGCDVPVLLVGEAGVGKRMIAHQIRVRSQRSARPIAIIDCQVLSAEIQKAQFLQVSRVSTESIRDEEDEESFPILDDPQGGTLLIHHAAHLAGELQARLVALAGAQPIPRWRLLLTERELPERVRAEGKWSEEFYQLITRLVVPIPPLRERREDLSLLAALMLTHPEAVNAVGNRAIELEPSAMARLAKYDFPGNVTELQQIVRRALRRSNRNTLTERDLPRFLTQADRLEVPADTFPLPSLNQVLESVERRMIELSLRRHRGNKSKAAKELGISRPRLHRRAQELGFAEDSPEENPAEGGKFHEDLGKDEQF